MESFYSLRQNHALDSRHWHTREDLQLAVVTWIESNRHRRRRQRVLEWTTPIEFETLHLALKAA
jgi:transposase InsO family protein